MWSQVAQSQYASSTHAHHSVELTVGPEEVVGSMAEVGHDQPAIAQCGELEGSPELSRPLALLSDLTDEPALPVDLRDAGGLAIEDVQIAGFIERDTRDLAEGLPGIAVERPDPEDFLEGGVQCPVRAGHLHHFLRSQRNGRENQCRDRPPQPFHPSCTNHDTPRFPL